LVKVIITALPPLIELIRAAGSEIMISVESDRRRPLGGRWTDEQLKTTM